LSEKLSREIVEQEIRSNRRTLMDWWLVFAIFLYFAAWVLIVAEVFLPSGGLLALCVAACVTGGLIIFFQHSAAAGWAGVVIAVVMIPSVLVGAFKILPKTKFGKNVTLEPPKRELGDGISDTAQLKELMGATGTVVTPMRPVGTCDFSGHRVECVAEGGYVEKGKKVRVIRMESTQLTVRVINEGQEQV
jgi:membrane-bound serine protease (ClpP class)